MDWKKIKEEAELKIKELQEMIDKLDKTPKFEEGKWYFFHNKSCEGRYLIKYISTEDHRINYQIMINHNNNFFTSSWIDIDCVFEREAEDNDVVEALKNVAKNKYKISYGSPMSNIVGEFDKIGSSFYMSRGCFMNNGWYKNIILMDSYGNWNGIIKEEIIKVGGYEVKKVDHDNYTIGCKKFHRNDFHSIKRLISKSEVQSVYFDSVEINIEIIDKILKLK